MVIERTHAGSLEEKVLASIRASFLKSPLVKSHRTLVNSPSTGCDNMQHIVYSHVSVLEFCWGWFCRQPLPGTSPNARLPGGDQVFSLTPAQLGFSDPLLPHSLGMVETFPKSKFPDTSLEPTLQAGVSRDSSLRPAI